MSDLFLKNTIKSNNISLNSESSFNIDKILRPIKKALPSINELSSTSFNNTQLGGSATSSANLSKINSNDVNHLLSMITSESSVNSNTNSVELENRLKKLLNQAGGVGITETSNNTATDVLEDRLRKLLNEQQGGSGVLKSLGALAALAGVGAYLTKDNASVTESDLLKPLRLTEMSQMPNVQGLMSETSNASQQVFAKPANTVKHNDSKHIVTTTEVGSPTLSATSTLNPFDPRMGDLENHGVHVAPRSAVSAAAATPAAASVAAARPAAVATPAAAATAAAVATPAAASVAATQVATQPQPSSLIGMTGGDNAALIAFREISSIVSKKLNISNGPGCKKIAGQLQRDVKEANPDIQLDDLVDAAKTHLNDNLSKYQKLVVKK